MNGLSLCAGGGSLDLGIEIAFPAYRCIAAVENNPEAVKRFRLRYPEAKVFRDVLGFDGRPLHGLVDSIVAGWPCQPHSVAGKRLGTADERWIWSDIARIIDETGAPLFFGENVSGLLRDATGQADEDGQPGELDNDPDGSMGGMGTVLRDLAEMGFVSFWGSLRAAQVGASHGRPRVFVLAYKPAHGRIRLSTAYHNYGSDAPWNEPDGRSEGLERKLWPTSRAEEFRIDRSAQREPGYADERDEVETADRMANASIREPQLPQRERPGPGEAPPAESQRDASGRSLLLESPFAPGPADPLWPYILSTSPNLAPALSPVTAGIALALSQGTFDLQAEIESGFRGLADGVARWLVERRPRLQIGGNGVVPLQAAAVFTELARRATLR